MCKQDPFELLLKGDFDGFAAACGDADDFGIFDWIEKGNPNHDPATGRFTSGGGGPASGAYTQTGGKDRSQKPDSDDVLNIVADVRDNWNYQEGMTLAPGKGGEFEQGGVKWNKAGECQLETGHVTIYRGTDWKDTESVERLTAHELMHGSYEKVYRQYSDDQRAIANDPRGVENIIKANGQLKAGFEKEFPTYGRMQRWIEDTETLRKDDGVTKYSKAYWRDAEAGKVSHHIAVHETLAEIAGAHHSTGKVTGSKTYRDFYKAVRNEYDVSSGKVSKRKGPGIAKKSAGETIKLKFSDHVMYLDDKFNPVDEAKSATYIRYWKSDGTNGLGIIATS